MKKLFVIALIIIICFHIVRAQNLVPNSSFENWSGGNPVSWTTNNNAGFDTTITQVSPGYVGSYDAMGATSVYSSLTFAPMLSNDDIPITMSYNNMQFYYKSNLLNNDIFIVQIEIFDEAANEIGKATDTITGNEGSFTLANINIPYTNTGPSYAEIIFSLANNVSVNTATHLGSYFIIDDVSLNVVAGVEEITANNKIQVYPVPAHDLLTVKGQTDNNKPMQFLLMDASGRVVMQRKPETPSDNYIDAEFNLQGIAPGVYSLEMITEEKVMMQRVVIQ